jgi:hypothetical protein
MGVNAYRKCTEICSIRMHLSFQCLILQALMYFQRTRYCLRIPLYKDVQVGYAISLPTFISLVIRNYIIRDLLAR